MKFPRGFRRKVTSGGWENVKKMQAFRFSIHEMALFKMSLHILHLSTVINRIIKQNRAKALNGIHCYSPICFKICGNWKSPFREVDPTLGVYDGLSVI